MRCDVCGGAKTPLFLSWVCDRCDEAKASGATAAQYTAFSIVNFRWTTPPERLIYGVPAFKLRGPADAVLHKQQANGYDLDCQVRRIGSDVPFQWDSLPAHAYGFPLEVSQDLIDIYKHPMAGKAWLIE